MDDAKRTPGYGKPPNRAELIQREATAWKLRCRGWTCARIGEQLGITDEGARRLLLRVERRESQRLSRHYCIP
jgi:hypothetical protein